MQRCGGVVKAGVRPAEEYAGFGGFTFMRQFQPPRLTVDIANATTQAWACGRIHRVGVDIGMAARHFQHQGRAAGDTPGGVGACQVVRRQRVALGDRAATDFERRVQAPLRVDPCRPKPRASLVHLIAHAQRLRIELVVIRTQKLVEQNAARERFEAVVGQAGQGPHGDDACALVAVAGDDLDFFAAFQHRVIREAIGA